MTDQTAAEIRRKMKIGEQIADQLKPVMPLWKVGRALNLTTERVRQIEAIALYKVAVRMKELTNFEQAI